jgi:hypothetical protein
VKVILIRTRYDDLKNQFNLSHHRLGSLILPHGDCNNATSVEIHEDSDGRLVNIGSFGNAELANSEQVAITSTIGPVEVTCNIDINDAAASLCKLSDFSAVTHLEL